MRIQRLATIVAIILFVAAILFIVSRQIGKSSEQTGSYSIKLNESQNPVLNESILSRQRDAQYSYQEIDPSFESQGAETQGSDLDAKETALQADQRKDSQNGLEKGIVLIIDDVGVNLEQSMRVLALPPEVTLSFLPYAAQLGRFLEQAIERGHDVVMHLPMKPNSLVNDPGPNALYPHLSSDQITSLLDTNFRSFSPFQNHIVAVNNHMGSGFMGKEEAVGQVLQYFAEKNIVFLDSLTSNDSVGMRVSKRLDLPYLRRDYFLDHKLSVPSIRKQWMQAMKRSKRQDLVIVIGHPYRITIDLIPELIKQAHEEGIRVLPLAQAIKTWKQSKLESEHLK